jgi:F0F1-type ATP synthase membrane subunit a
MPNIGAGEIILLLLMLVVFAGFIAAIVVGVIWLSRKMPRS